MTASQSATVTPPKAGYRGAPYIGPSESQSAAMAQGRGGLSSSPAPRRQRLPLPVVKYRELHDALEWFRDAWETAPGKVERLHTAQVNDGDEWGGPEWHRRFVRFLVDGPETYDAVRMAWARMRYTGGLADRTGAAFLFVLACRDFDLRSSGLAMLGHCVCPQIHLPECHCENPGRVRHQHGVCPSPSQPLFEEYCAWFAERAIARLRELVESPPRDQPVDRPAWMDRIGFSPRERAASSG